MNPWPFLRVYATVKGTCMLLAKGWGPRKAFRHARAFWWLVLAACAPMPGFHVSEAVAGPQTYGSEWHSCAGGGSCREGYACTADGACEWCGGPGAATRCTGGMDDRVTP